MGPRFRGFFPSDESVQVIAERAKCAEGFLIEEAHGSAAQANLVRISLHPDGPTHFAVPATSERDDGRSGQAGGYDSGPPPAGFSWFFSLDGIGLCMGHGIGHGISGRRLEGCCNHRANRGRGQNLKGRSWGLPARLRRLRVADRPSTNHWTCTNGHCDTSNRPLRWIGTEVVGSA